MKRELLLLVLGLIALSFMSGCASIFTGSTQPITFNSEPDGATVKIDGVVYGKTPATVPLKGKKDATAEFSKEGYKTQSMPITQDFNMWVLANVIWCFACPLSTTTDYMTGAAYEYSPNKYFVTLVPTGSALSTAPTGTNSKKTEVKAFMVGNYGNIMNELSSASGEYLKTLYAMLEIPEPDRQKAFNKIKTIADGTKDAVKFADDVIAAFIP